MLLDKCVPRESWVRLTVVTWMSYGNWLSRWLVLLTTGSSKVKDTPFTLDSSADVMHTSPEATYCLSVCSQLYRYLTSGENEKKKKKRNEEHNKLTLRTLDFNTSWWNMRQEACSVFVLRNVCVAKWIGCVRLLESCLFSSSREPRLQLGKGSLNSFGALLNLFFH